MSWVVSTESNWEFDGFDLQVERRTDPSDASAQQKRTVSTFRRKRYGKGLTSFTSEEDTTAAHTSITADYGSDTGITPSSGTWRCEDDSLLPFRQGSGIYINQQAWSLYGSWGSA